MSNAPGWGQVLMSNPHLRCGDARGWGLKLTGALEYCPLIRTLGFGACGA